MRALLERFDVVRFALGARTALTTPDGRKTTADAWARELGVTYTPTIVFFDGGGREVFRVDAYLRPFHLASSLDYVASGAYRDEPSFQRFIQARAERLRARGRARRLVEVATVGRALPASHERHLRRHDGQELDVGVDRQARHVDDCARHVRDVHQRLDRDLAVRLWHSVAIRAAISVSALPMSI